MTGEDPEAHGIYSEWCWEPATMSLSNLNDGKDVEPFWKVLARAGRSVGILAIPFMPFVGVSDGFEVSDQSFPSKTNGAPAGAVADLIAREARNALAHGHVSVDGPEDYQHLEQLAADSLTGIRLRGKFAEALLKESQPDLAVIVFTELHESAHCLWQMIEPDHPLYAEPLFERVGKIQPNLKEMFQEVDRQIETLIKTADDNTAILVFSLHGMQPARGVPTFLEPLMTEAGFSRISKGRDRSLKQRATDLAAAVKRRTPQRLKRIYYKNLPRSTVLRLATPNMMPPYDWSQTRAFPLVIEQHGSIRVNLAGREAKGIVTVESYKEVCDQIEDWLYTLTTSDGKRLTKKVFKTATNGEQALNRRIPDVIVHWEDAAFASPLRVKNSSREFHREGSRYLSQHTSEGFCILRCQDASVEQVMPVKDLGALITSIAGGSNQAARKAAGSQD